MHRGERCTFHLASHSSPATTREHVQWWAAYRAVLFFSGTLTFPLVSIFWLYFRFTFQLSPRTNFFFSNLWSSWNCESRSFFFFFSFSTFCKKWVKMKNVGSSKFLIFNLSSGISGTCHGTDKFPLRLSDIPAPVRGVAPSRGWHSRGNASPICITALDREVVWVSTCLSLHIPLWWSSLQKTVEQEVSRYDLTEPNIWIFFLNEY